MKYFFWILGCAMNYSDAERMATVLDSMGYTRTDRESEADLFIVISCSVRESAALSIYGKVKDLRELKIKNKKLKTILTGCVIEKDKKKLGKVFDIMMTIEDLPRLPELLGYPSNDNAYEKSEPSSSHIRSNNKTYLSIVPHYESSFRAYVPISTGCDNFCTYCAVPYTRGREKSRPIGEIITEVRDLVAGGYKEITLLGQNVNSFGTNNKKQITNNKFVELLKELDAIPGDHRIYFYSNHPKDMSDELIETMAVLKHFPHYIHLPLQSGNDELLRQMNRHYTKEQYLNLVAKIRKTMPDITLTTDIIVGFPDETAEQFADTADVTGKAEYDMAFIAQYSPRSGTVSAKQPDNVTKEEKKRREKILQEIVKDTVLKHNQKLIGTIQNVLIDEAKNNKYYGRTIGYKVVEIKTDLPRGKAGQSLKLGQFIDVNIETAGSWKLVGTTRLK